MLTQGYLGNVYLCSADQVLSAIAATIKRVRCIHKPAGDLGIIHMIQNPRVAEP